MFTTRFIPQVVWHAKETTFYELRQGTLSVADYTHAFRLLERHAKGLTKEWWIEKYINEMECLLKTLVHTDNYFTFDVIHNMALK